MPFFKKGTESFEREVDKRTLAVCEVFMEGGFEGRSNRKEENCYFLSQSIRKVGKRGLERCYTSQLREGLIISHQWLRGSA